MQDGDALVIWNLGHLSTSLAIQGRIYRRFTSGTPPQQKFHLIVLKHHLDTSKGEKHSIHPLMAAMIAFRDLPLLDEKETHPPKSLVFQQAPIHDYWTLNVRDGNGGGDGGGNGGC
jgi:hypothetical protein